MPAGERLYTCARCDKSFLRVEHIQIHLQIHTREKPYTCQTCDKSLSQVEDLKTHLRVHTVEKPYTRVVQNNFFFKFNPSPPQIVRLVIKTPLSEFQLI